jgi:hypothetical protein
LDGGGRQDRPVTSRGVNETTEALLAGEASLPAAPAGDRTAVAVGRADDRGAVLWLGPRSDGGTRFLCVMARRGDDGRWRAYEDHGDRWPDAAADAAAGAPPLQLASAFIESDEERAVVVLPARADASVARVLVQGGPSGSWAPAQGTGAVMALAVVPADTAAVVLRAQRPGGEDVTLRVALHIDR